MIFDCDGVIADTEPLHLAAFQRVLSEEGITLTEEEYFQTYLAFDDRGCYTTAFRNAGRELSDQLLAELIARKARYIEPAMRDNLKMLPGAVAFIREASLKYPIAIASGALRREIELILKHGDILDCFKSIVSAEDVTRGKPDPEIFLKACRQINEANGGRITPAACLVIEDSIHGIHAARAAGMRCLAVTNSYPKEKLAEADRVVETLEQLSLNEMESLFAV
jgi:HAD superfamily hydrolase (TIGR01509 family)